MMIRHKVRLWLLLFPVLMLTLGLFTAAAQETAPVEYGTVVVGTIPADGQQVAYSFNGSAGDLVTVQVLGITPGWQPTVTLLNPSQQPLTTNNNLATVGSLRPGAEISYRLFESGTHFVVVSGTTGDFVLSLSARTAVVSTALVLNTPLNVALPLTDPTSVFVFNTDPLLATTLLIDAAPFDLNASIEIRNGVGQVTASLHGSLDNACISFVASDEVNEITISGSPEVTGSITLTLSNAPCELGQAPPQPVANTPQFVPIPIEGVCAASSFRNVNIRSGPSTIFSIVSILPSRQPIQVVGRIEDGSWYAVQSPFVQGWISASVVSVTGPCDTLQVISPPAAPAASPTPGLPVVTVVVTVIAPVTTTPPTDSTATLTPEVTTEPPTATVETPVPTSEVPTATP
jgi:uncharacterized protein YraI